MTIPYADLRISAITVDPTAQSSGPLNVTWTVVNDGIGRTDRAQWTDTVQLATNPDGTGVVASFSFDHIGVLGAGGSYTRSADITVPNGVSGTYYVRVGTSGPFEFIYTSNNTAVSGPVAVTLAASPDLKVTNIVAPLEADEGASIDVSWTVLNDGAAPASGRWTDTLALRKSGDPTSAPVGLGSFTYEAGLAAGISYTRTERIKLPAKIEGAWQLVVTTNAGGAVYEFGAAATNNTTGDDASILLSLLPRPDLQVQNIVAPDRVVAGATLAVNFEIVNRGSVAANGQWRDNVYLSLDNKAGGDDILIGSFLNGSALDTDQAYSTQTSSIIVPERFRGQGFILVIADASGSSRRVSPAQRDRTTSSRRRSSSSRSRWPISSPATSSCPRRASTAPRSRCATPSPTRARRPPIATAGPTPSGSPAIRRGPTRRPTAASCSARSPTTARWRWARATSRS